MNRLVQILGVSTIAGITAASYYHSIQLKGNFTIPLFKFLSSFEEKYSKNAFEFLTRFTFFKNNGTMDLRNKILVGFDTDGRYLQGLALLGLGGVEVGPISQNPDQNGNDLGIMYTKANIYSMLEKYRKLNNINREDNYKDQKDNQNNNERLKIGIKIIPDKQVIEFTPYLIGENILNCSKNIMGDIDQKQAIQVVKVDQRKQKSGEIVMRKAKIPKLADLITIDVGQILTAIGEQNRKQANAMISKMFASLVNQVGKPHQIPIYEFSENNYRLVYNPTESKNKEKLEFITWRDIIRLIINS